MPAMTGTEATFKVANPWARRWLWFVVGLVTAIGIVLYVFPRRTEDLFAWTIGSPMTAAFLGASYLASIPLSLLASLRRYWASMRLPFPGVGVFSALTLIATLIHLDVFHTDTAPGVVWITVYIISPITFFGILIWMTRAPGTDPPRTSPLVGWERALLLLVALVMIPFGVALFVAPGWADGAWPWALTSLTARAIGAWLAGVGTVVLHMHWENDWKRIVPGPPELGLLGLLHLGAVARFSNEFNWDGVGAWLYVGCLVLFIAIGIYGVLKCWRMDILLTRAEG